ncbi:MAG: hypothetical protein HFH87_08445 [Lachnospiraceae bacterium]|nr:hypothetical protein [Lachnospiraceae bacterium]
MMLFTWKDIENTLLFNKEKWNAAWKKISVYPDEVVIYKDEAVENEQDIECLNDILGSCYRPEQKCILLDPFEVRLPVSYEEMDEWEVPARQEVPLFREMYLKKEDSSAVEKEELPGKPVIAFHSYKGGVGRTLSVIALVKEIGNRYGNQRKVLVVDSDLEAPGLTWVLEEGPKFSMSYLDLLSIVSVYGDTEEVIDKVVGLMQTDTVYMNTDTERVKIFFLPAYLRKEQMLTMMPKIDSLLHVSDNPYVITDVISRLGAALEADLVVIDLRAGVSNISAPFLFDRRVQKYFISSTSLQSIKGTRFVEEQVYSRSRLHIENTKVFLTMIPNELSEEGIQQIMDQLTQIPEIANDGADETYLRDEYAYAVQFESRLLGLGDFDEICQAIRGTGLSQVMNQVASNLLCLKERNDMSNSEMEEKKIREGLKALHGYLNITAESSDAADILLTDSIHKIITKHQKELTNIVVLGAKGSGKTYLYRQFVQRQSWNSFAGELCGGNVMFPGNAAFIPLLTTKNDQKIFSAVECCLEEADRYVGDSLIDFTACQGLREEVESCLREGNENNWLAFWEKRILGLFGNQFATLQELNQHLSNVGRNIIFLLDGLDDLFNLAVPVERVETLVQALCQDLPPRLNRLKDRHIGMIIFVRRDIAEESIRYNFQQFRDQYKEFSLNWSQTEALRLALWVAGKAIPEFSMQEDIQTLGREKIEERLETLWGKKLGKEDSKEANSARWILAALSDLKGQLQARDIVRFLFYASENGENVALKFPDRYLMPSAVRAAIEPCASEKLKEIEDEMKTVYQILEKFEKVEERKLPLTLDKITLSVEELAKLEEQGYIKVEDKKYYLPEIIRQALGYRYESGARPKVLSLLVK